MLTQMLHESGVLNDMPPSTKTIVMKLAGHFQSSTHFLFMSPEELEEATGYGTKDQWTELLRLQETKNYIKGQMAAFAEISQRKTFQSLLQSALQGNAQASKQVMELSGIMNQQDTNRTIVLHRIPRAEKSVN